MHLNFRSTIFEQSQLFANVEVAINRQSKQRGLVVATQRKTLVRCDRHWAIAVHFFNDTATTEIYTEREFCRVGQQTDN